MTRAAGFALVLVLGLTAACGSEDSPVTSAAAGDNASDPEVYLGLESLVPNPDDPSPDRSRGIVVLDERSELYIGGNDQVQVWVGRELPQMLEGRPALSMCVHAQIGPERLPSATPCPMPEQFVEQGVSIPPSAHHDWVEIYLVPDGFGDVEVPGLERVTAHLYVGDTRETAPPGQIITGVTGSFRLVNDMPPSTA